MRKSPYKYGYRQTQGYRPPNKPEHTGYDFVGQKQNGSDWIGAPILAVVSGKVWRAKYNDPVGGHYVVIEENGRYWYYGHLKSIAVVEDEWVSEDQTVGHQGATGPVSGEHLHFELRYGSYDFASSKRTDVMKFIEMNTVPPLGQMWPQAVVYETLIKWGMGQPPSQEAIDNVVANDINLITLLNNLDTDPNFKYYGCLDSSEELDALKTELNIVKPRLMRVEGENVRLKDEKNAIIGQRDKLKGKLNRIKRIIGGE